MYLTAEPCDTALLTMQFVLYYSAYLEIHAASCLRIPLILLHILHSAARMRAASDKILQTGCNYVILVD